MRRPTPDQVINDQLITDHSDHYADLYVLCTYVNTQTIYT